MIRMSPETIAAIRAHAERTYPHECCGALLGRAGSAPAPGATKWVLALEPVANRSAADQAARRFLITADDYRAIEKVARAKQLAKIDADKSVTLKLYPKQRSAVEELRELFGASEEAARAAAFLSAFASDERISAAVQAAEQGKRGALRARAPDYVAH